MLSWPPACKANSTSAFAAAVGSAPAAEACDVRRRRAGSSRVRRSTATAQPGPSAVIVCTLDSDHGFASASAPSQRVSVCAPRCTASESAEAPAVISSCASGVVDRQLLRRRRRFGKPVRPAVADVADRDLHRPFGGRDERRPRCTCTTARWTARCPSPLRPPPSPRRPAPPARRCVRRLPRRARPASRRHPPSMPRPRRPAASPEVDTPSHTATATEYGRPVSPSTTMPAAAASSLRACSIPRSVISTIPPRSASSRSGSARR